MSLDDGNGNEKMMKDERHGYGLKPELAWKIGRLDLLACPRLGFRRMITAAPRLPTIERRRCIFQELWKAHEAGDDDGRRSI